MSTLYNPQFTGRLVSSSKLPRTLVRLQDLVSSPLYRSVYYCWWDGRRLTRASDPAVATWFERNRGHRVWTMEFKPKGANYV